MIQNLIFGILLLKMLFPANNFFIFNHVPVDIIRGFFSISDFLAESLKANKNYPQRSLILQYGFAQKTSLISCTSTHLKLKILCSRNTAKILSDFATDFSANMFLFGVRKKHLHCAISWHPKTAFLKHFESKCLYISVYSCISNYQNFCSKDIVRFYLVAWGWWEAE